MRLLFFLFLISCNFSPKLQQDILRAQELISKGEYKNATGLYEKILTMNMTQDLRIKIIYQVADLHSIFLGDVETGKKYYNKIFEYSENVSDQTKALERIGELNFTYLKNYKEALSAYERLLTYQNIDHDFFELRLALSHFYLGNFEQSQKELEKISHKPDHQYGILSIYYLGLIQFRQGHWEPAIEMWKKYLEVETRKDKKVEVRYLMANAYETMENLKEAYAIYYSLLGEYPNTTVIQNRLKAIYQRKVSRKR